MINPYFNEDHESLQEMARDFAEKVLAPIAAEIDETNHIPEEVVSQMAEMGFFGIKIPEEYGGMGLDTRSYVAVMEQVARKCAVATTYISSAASLSTAAVIMDGTEEQKQKYLPPVVTGESFIAFSLTEPGAGSDAASINTKAVRDGDVYVINGRKCFITGGEIADQAVVCAKTAPELGVKGISVFMVDMKLPGVSVGKAEKKLGQHGMCVNDLIFKDVRVPADCMIGPENLGFISAMKTLSIGRIGIAAMALGIAQDAIDLAVAHLKEREQFGKPLAAQQGLQFMLADMETKLNAARLLTYDAAYKVDTKQKADKAASMAKYYASESAISIVNDALQMFGGYGYSEEYEICRLYRDVRVLSIYEGTSQIQQKLIAGSLLK